MALSDCSKCWETPCSCGNEYKHHSTESFANYIVEITYGAKGKNCALEILRIATETIQNKK